MRDLIYILIIIFLLVYIAQTEWILQEYKRISTQRIEYLLKEEK